MKLSIAALRRARFALLGWVTAGWQVSCTMVLVNNQPSKSTQLCIPPWWVNRVPACLLWLKLGAFACVGLQATLCDPIWQLMLRSLYLLRWVSYNKRTILTVCTNSHAYGTSVHGCVHLSSLCRL